MCQECTIAQEWPGYRTFNPLCLHCGARYVKQLRGLELGKTQLEKWRLHVMETWESNGHDRQALRDLAMGKELPYAGVPAPVAKTKRKAKA